MIPSKHRGVFKIAAVQKGFSVKDRDHWRRVLECLSPKDQLDEIIKDKGKSFHVIKFGPGEGMHHMGEYNHVFLTVVEDANMNPSGRVAMTLGISYNDGFTKVMLLHWLYTS